MNTQSTLQGAGLGLRREFLDKLHTISNPPIDFLEVAPENWLHVGGRRQKLFQHYAERYPILCHGLSLSLGGPRPLDENLLTELKYFFETYNVPIYSEHLSFCSDNRGQLYDLLPMPFTLEAARYIAKRIREVQERLERTIAIENVSYYLQLSHEMNEHEFLLTVLEEADCDLLLDVNNVYVNSINHGYNALDFIKTLPAEKIAYIHVAGHKQLADNLIVDTHGSDVIDPVWDLLSFTYQQFGHIPTLLERDNAIPPLEQLFEEMKIIKTLQANIEVPDYA